MVFRDGRQGVKLVDLPPAYWLMIILASGNLEPLLFRFPWQLNQKWFRLPLVDFSKFTFYRSL